MNSWASDFLLFATVGFFAQIVDGALGMGYGIIASTVLLATGVAPAHTSASVNGSKIFTSAASGLSHIYNGNVDRRLLVILSIAGAIGGVLGAMLLISVPPGATRPYMFAYLFLMGLIIIWRGTMPAVKKTPSGAFVAPVGTVGGFLDAFDGGGWGLVVTSSLIGAGAAPRFVVGTVNAAQFVVTCTIISAFAATAVLGMWHEANGPANHLAAVAGLVIGGIPSALFAGWLLQVAPRTPLMIAAGVTICAISAWQIWKTFA
ncbi:sulfite exporter TauE/SafE family protein [Aestuariivirga sp.]|uniref:sulfite exporter TauE/SafE family protein n=1 Tax=Aestuariivirga sp. TaxID=2650926 RepID=UPI003BABD954